METTTQTEPTTYAGGPTPSENHEGEAPGGEYPLGDDERHADIARLIMAVRNVNGLFPLRDDDLVAAIADWDETLAEVPTEELRDLRREGLQRGLKTGADFLKLHRGLVQQRAFEANSAAMQARDHALRHMAMSGALDGGNGARCAELQRQRWDRGLLAVSCECVQIRAANGYEYRAPAVLSPDGKYFVCSTGHCDFQWPVARFMEAPSVGEVGPLGGRPAEKAKPPAPRHPPELTLAAAACNLDLDEMSPQTFAHFRLFVRWFKERYETGLSPQMLEEYWPVWAQEYTSQTKTDNEG